MAIKDLYYSAFMEEKITYIQDNLQVLQQNPFIFTSFKLISPVKKS